MKRSSTSPAVAALLAALILSTTGPGQARELLRDGAMGVHVADLGFCEETVTVELRGPASAFAGDLFPVYRAIAVLTAIVPAECPQATALRALGMVDGQPVWQGRATLPDGAVTELEVPGPQDRVPLDRRDMVAEIQAALNALGYDAGPVDGLIGPATRGAIRTFQADTGQTVDGAADPGLVLALRQTAPPAPLAAAPGEPVGGKRPPPLAQPGPSGPADPAPDRPAGGNGAPPSKPTAAAGAATGPEPPVARLLAPLEFDGWTVDPGLLPRSALGALWDRRVAMGGNLADGVSLTLPDGSARTVTNCGGWFSAQESGGEPATTFDRSMASFFHRTCDPVVALGNAPTVEAARLTDAAAPPLDLAAWSPVLGPDLSGERQGKLAAFAEAGRSLAEVADAGSAAPGNGSIAFTWQGVRRTLEPVALAQLDDDPSLEALVFVADHAVDGTYRAYRLLTVDRDPDTGLYRPD